MTRGADEEAVRACLDVADEHRIVVEPACGAAVAATVQRRVPVLQAASEVLVILCGGVATTYGDLQALAVGGQEDAI